MGSPTTTPEAASASCSTAAPRPPGPRPTFLYHRPATLEEAWEIKRTCAAALYLAGGTDLMVQLRSGDLCPPALISLRRVEELRGIAGASEGKTIEIHSMTTIGELLAHRALGAALPVLHQAARTLGSPQVRNSATIGGNLCNASPCADTAPPLLVLEARLRIEGPDGARELPLEEFFVAPNRTRLHDDEVLAAVLIDRPPPTARATFSKKSRVRMDLAQVSLALLLDLDGARCNRARIAAGSVGPRPLRLREAERALEGRDLDPAVIAEASAVASGEVAPIDDVRSTATYRRQMVGVYLQRAATRLLERGQR